MCLEKYALSLDGWEISKAQAESIIDGIGIGSEVLCIDLISLNVLIKPLLLQIISFYMKLLMLKHIEKCNKKDAFMTTYFYQRWESFFTKP